MGVQVAKAGGTTARINAAAAGSLTELSQAFPVQVIDPGVHKLVEEGGFRRRRWMDWAVFHVEPGFADVWVRYTPGGEAAECGTQDSAGAGGGLGS